MPPSVMNCEGCFVYDRWTLGDAFLSNSRCVCTGELAGHASFDSTDRKLYHTKGEDMKFLVCIFLIACSTLSAAQLLEEKFYAVQKSEEV